MKLILCLQYGSLNGKANRQNLVLFTLLTRNQTLDLPMFAITLHVHQTVRTKRSTITLNVSSTKRFVRFSHALARFYPHKFPFSYLNSIFFSSSFLYVSVCVCFQIKWYKRNFYSILFTKLNKRNFVVRIYSLKKISIIRINRSE